MICWAKNISKNAILYRRPCNFGTGKQKNYDHQRKREIIV
jgi:hypothetical protein